MGICSNDRIRVSDLTPVRFAAEYDARQVLDIHLMDDPCRRGHYAKITESRLTPTQKGITLGVSTVFQFRIALQRLGLAEMIHHDRMIDHEISGRKRVNPVRITLQTRDRFTHRGEIHHRRHSGEILHQDTGWRKGNLGFATRRRLPPCQRLDIIDGRVGPVFGSEKIFQENLQGHR